MGEGEDNNSNDNGQSELQDMFLDKGAVDALNELASTEVSETECEEVQEETPVEEDSDLESTIESDNEFLGEPVKQIVLDNGTVIDLEEIKPPDTKDTALITHVSLDKSFQDAIATADTDSIVQADAETRIEAPKPPYKVLFVGSKEMIFDKIRYDYIHPKKTQKIKMKTLSTETGQDLEINDDHSKNIILQPGEYDDATLEKLVKDHIKKLAASNLYHIMVVCCENPENSAKIVGMLRNQNLKREEGFMMPYIILGKLSPLSKAEAYGENVHFFDLDEDNEQSLADLITKAINDSYKAQEFQFKVLIMTKDKDLKNPYENLELPPNIEINYFVVQANETDYRWARNRLKNDNYNAVIVDGDADFQKRLICRVGDYPNTIPLAFVDSDEMSDFGASQFDIKETYKTPEKRLNKLITLIKDSLKFEKTMNFLEPNVKYEQDTTIVLTNEGKAYRKVKEKLFRKKFEP